MRRVALTDSAVAVQTERAVTGRIPGGGCSADIVLLEDQDDLAVAVPEFPRRLIAAGQVAKGVGASAPAVGVGAISVVVDIKRLDERGEEIPIVGGHHNNDFAGWNGGSLAAQLHRQEQAARQRDGLARVEHRHGADCQVIAQERRGAVIIRDDDVGEQGEPAIRDHVGVFDRLEGRDDPAVRRLHDGEARAILDQARIHRPIGLPADQCVAARQAVGLVGIAVEGIVCADVGRREHKTVRRGEHDPVAARNQIREKVKTVDVGIGRCHNGVLNAFD